MKRSECISKLGLVLLVELLEPLHGGVYCCVDRLQTALRRVDPEEGIRGSLDLEGLQDADLHDPH